MAVLTLDLPRPYLLFLGEATEPAFAKTAFGLRDWAVDHCVGELALPAATVTTGLPRLTAEAAHAAGARSLVIGIANMGGVVEPAWIPTLRVALRAGLDLVSGMRVEFPSRRSVRSRLFRSLDDPRTGSAARKKGLSRSTTSQSWRKLGSGAQACILVRLNAHGRAGLDEFVAATARLDEVSECWD